MAVFVLFRGVAVKAWVAVPASRETGLAGERLILAGVGKFVVVVGLLLLQPVNASDQTDGNRDECPPDY